MDYIINGSHQFKITISANVVPKTLVLEDQRTSIEFGNYSPTDAFPQRTMMVPLSNPLQSPIKYHWDIGADSAFQIEPLTGENSNLLLFLNASFYLIILILF